MEALPRKMTRLVRNLSSKTIRLNSGRSLCHFSRIVSRRRQSLILINSNLGIRNENGDQYPRANGEGRVHLFDQISNCRHHHPRDHSMLTPPFIEGDLGVSHPVSIANHSASHQSPQLESCQPSLPEPVFQRRRFFSSIYDANQLNPGHEFFKPSSPFDVLSASNISTNFSASERAEK